MIHARLRAHLTIAINSSIILTLRPPVNITPVVVSIDRKRKRKEIPVVVSHPRWGFRVERGREKRNGIRRRQGANAHILGV